LLSVFVSVGFEWWFPADARVYAGSLANRAADRAFARAASATRFFGSALVVSDAISVDAAAATSSTARSNASWFAAEGRVKPESFRTNCSEASLISCSVAGGSKLNSVRMFLHMIEP
jgi:hypothetical protein